MLFFFFRILTKRDCRPGERRVCVWTVVCFFRALGTNGGAYRTSLVLSNPTQLSLIISRSFLWVADPVPIPFFVKFRYLRGTGVYVVEVELGFCFVCVCVCVYCACTLLRWCGRGGQMLLH